MTGKTLSNRAAFWARLFQLSALPVAKCIGCGLPLTYAERNAAQAAVGLELCGKCVADDLTILREGMAFGPKGQEQDVERRP